MANWNWRLQVSSTQIRENSSVTFAVFLFREQNKIDPNETINNKTVL